MKEISPMKATALEQVKALEQIVASCPQVNIETSHTLHAGMYARTVKIPAGVIATGALIKIDTLLIVQGTCLLHIGGAPVKMEGYNLILGGAGRKQACHAIEDTFVTMMFATKAKTVEEAEAEFTDEFEDLMSRKEGSANHVLMAEDKKCLA